MLGSSQFLHFLFCPKDFKSKTLSNLMVLPYDSLTENKSIFSMFFTVFFHKFEQTHIKHAMFILDLINHIFQTEFFEIKNTHTQKNKQTKTHTNRK